MNPFFNTSPLIFLEKLGLIDKLLPKLWDKIYITTAVVQEINDRGQKKGTGKKSSFHVGMKIRTMPERPGIFLI